MVSVGEENFFTLGGILPPAGSRYDDPLWKGILPTDYLKRFSDYVYTTQGEDTKDGGTLLFGPPDELNDPNDPFSGLKPFRVTSWKGNHYWHTILLELTPVLVDGFPNATQVGTSTVNSDRYVMRERYIPAATEGTLFVKSEYISSTTPRLSKSPVPIASAVTYDIINRRGGFPECIHDKIVIQAVTTVTGKSLPQQIFLETEPYTTWVPYILSQSEPILSGGVWYWHSIRVIPPIVPEERVTFAF